MFRVKNDNLVAIVILLSVSMVIGCWAAGSYAAEPKPTYGGILRISEQLDGGNIGRPSKMRGAVFAQRHVAPALETLFRVDKDRQDGAVPVASAKENAKAQTITTRPEKGD